MNRGVIQYWNDGIALASDETMETAANGSRSLQEQTTSRGYETGT
jgi:hypothetical protein